MLVYDRFPHAKCSDDDGKVGQRHEMRTLFVWATVEGFSSSGEEDQAPWMRRATAHPTRAPHRRSSVLCAGKQTRHLIRELWEAHHLLDVRLKSREPRILLFPVEAAVSSYIYPSSSRAPPAWCPIGVAIFSCWFSFRDAS